MSSAVDNLHSLQGWHDFLQQCESSQASFAARQDAAAEDCRQRESILTKPGASLGRLEELTSWFYRTRGVYDNLSPEKLLAHVLVFAGNHGVAANQVSAFPPIVTAAMVKNFVGGGAAINQLATYAHANLQVISMNNLNPTKNFTNPEEPTPAMTEQECCDAMKLGFQSVDKNSHVVVLGEMGIANSTAAAAICHALYGGEVESWVGRGTGIDDAMLGNKQQAVKHGVAQYKKYRAAQAVNPNQVVGQGLSALQFLGGFEMAGMAGAMAAGLYHHLPIILDSYVTVASLACLAQHVKNSQTALAGIMTPHCPADWHQSPIQGATSSQSSYHGHSLLLKHLQKTPLVDLGLRLGEGTGGVMALQILRGALACHHGMATFETAGVASKI